MCAYLFFTSRLVAGILRLLHDVLLGGLALALGVLDTFHLLVLRLGRHCGCGCVCEVSCTKSVQLMRSDKRAIGVFLCEMLCDDEEEAVNVSTRAVHYFSR